MCNSQLAPTCEMLVTAHVKLVVVVVVDIRCPLKAIRDFQTAQTLFFFYLANHKKASEIKD